MNSEEIYYISEKFLFALLSISNIYRNHIFMKNTYLAKQKNVKVNCKPMGK